MFEILDYTFAKPCWGFRNIKMRGHEKLRPWSYLLPPLGNPFPEIQIMMYKLQRLGPLSTCKCMYNNKIKISQKKTPFAKNFYN